MGVGFDWTQGREDVPKRGTCSYMAAARSDGARLKAERSGRRQEHPWGVWAHNGDRVDGAVVGLLGPGYVRFRDHVRRFSRSASRSSSSSESIDPSPSP